MNVELVLNLYLAMVPLKDIWKDQASEVSFSSCDQRLIFQKICHHQLNRTFPPLESYQRGFLKNVILQAEDNGHEVIDEVYELFTNLISSSHVVGGSKNNYCYKSYNIGPGSYVTMKESVNMISGGTTGLVTWQASIAFVEWLISSQNFKDFSGKSVLELGCGVGFAGISLCKLCGPSRYIFTDCHAAVLEQLEENIDINLKDDATDKNLRCLDWTQEREVTKLLSMEGKLVDCILATDVVYDCDTIGPLIVAMAMMASFNPEVKMYFASTIRNGDTYKHFLDGLALHDLGWTKMEAHHLPSLYYDRTQRVELLKIARETELM